MNRKHNPWVSLVALLLLVTLLVFICTGCGVLPAEAEEPARFTAEKVDCAGGGLYAYVITDEETGVQYLYIGSSHSAGLTVLQPAPAEIKEGA